jgi:DNA-binding response OmpR family regulator
VEDNADTCELIEAWLKYGDGSFSMETTDSVDNALDQIRSEKFDLVVIDSWLPGGSGVELCREIRKINAKIPIMFFSGDARPAAIKDGVAAGANLYLTKPVTGDEFMAAVNKLTGYECQTKSSEKAVA